MLCSQPANFRDWHHITTKAKAIAKLQAFERGDDVVDGHVGGSAQSTGIKNADFDDRPWQIVAGPKISAAVYHCTALPVDPETARRSNAANDWERIRKESVLEAAE